MTEAAQKNPKLRMKLSAAVGRSLREGTLWILCALALLLVLALLSYQPHDPGFADTGEPGPVSNWIGPIGACRMSHHRPRYLRVAAVRLWTWSFS